MCFIFSESVSFKDKAFFAFPLQLSAVNKEGDAFKESSPTGHQQRLRKGFSFCLFVFVPVIGTGLLRVPGP